MAMFQLCLVFCDIERSRSGAFAEGAANDSDEIGATFTGAAAALELKKLVPSNELHVEHTACGVPL